MPNLAISVDQLIPLRKSGGETPRSRIVFVASEGPSTARLEKEIEALGHRVVGRVPAGPGAIEGIRRLEPDLVVVVGDGAAQWDMQRELSVPVFVLTGSSDHGAVPLQNQDKKVGYLLKPIAAGDWVRELEVVLRRCPMAAAARTREQLLLATLRCIADGIVTTDENERVTFLNPVAERLTGWSLMEARGRALTDVMELRHEKTRELVQAPMHEALAERHLARLQGSALLIGKNGTIAVDESAAPLVDDDANVFGGVLVLRDVTERRRTEEELRCYQRMEAIGQLTGGVAHDFNNILAAILAYIHFLSDSFDAQDPRRQDADEVRKAAERGAALTRQLLAFSKRQALEPTVLNLNEVVTDLERMLRRLIDEGIALMVLAEPSLGLISADRGQIEQVIVNLVVNARDAMPRGGTLRIETSNVEIGDDNIGSHFNVVPGSYVLLTVSDTGCGMDAETRRRAFEPFFTTKGPGKGTGLGLSTCYGIVQQSGGHIWIYSEPGEGAVFKVFLPRTSRTDRVDSIPVSKRNPSGRAATVLLVEDDDDVRRVVSRVLSQKGYTLLSARDGQEAVRLAEAHTGSLDLLLSDVIVPGTNGTELLERVRARFPEVKALFMSGYTDHPVLRDEIVGERRNFIQKPFAPGALLDKVREALDP